MKNAALALFASVSVTACGGAEEAPPPEAVPEPEAIGTVTITYPTDGAVVDAGALTVTLSSTVTIVEAGVMTPETGHHHLDLDADLTDATVPVPTVPGSIVHMGDASSEFTFENVEAGEHRLIAVVADGVHVPLQPWVVDTVTFTVR